ncbi:MAG TPA: hypothetical protein VL863_05915 [bacterium]|nr:hypothetical protein [bacterium]
MNFHRSSNLTTAARWLCAVLVVLVLGGAVHAQPAEGGRWLLVFDTSTTMKKRWTSTLEAANHFIATGADGQLQAGDNVAIWTYGRQLSAGQFPVATWDPAHSTLLGSNLVRLLRSQRFTNDSSFAPLKAPLGQVIASSERLTIVIFCDGLSSINFTPYDAGINQNFSDGQAERKKSSQPFVVVLRTQLGKFVGCTVSYPPGNINVPSFPPLPPPPAPVAVRTQTTPASQTPPVVPDLVIIGKTVGTNENLVAEAVAPPVKPAEAVAKATNSPVVTTPIAPPPAKAATTPVPPAPAPMTQVPAPPAVKPATNPSIVTVVTQAVTKPIAPVVTQAPAPVIAAPITTNTTVVAASAANERHTRLFIFIGIGLLVVAIVLAVMILRAGRRPHASLITSSMNDDPRRK